MFLVASSPCFRGIGAEEEEEEEDDMELKLNDAQQEL